MCTHVCCLVPFEEDPKDPSVWFLDHNYVEAMNDMFKKVNGNYTHAMRRLAQLNGHSISKGKADRLVS